MSRTMVLGVFLVGLLVAPSVLADNTVTCSLPPQQAYKTATEPGIYYITNTCKKKAFTDPERFYSYFSSFDVVQIVSSGALDAIPYARNMYMEWGSGYDPGDGGLVKTPDDARVYLFVDGTVYPIDRAETFLNFGYTWEMIDTVSEEFMAMQAMGDTITGEDGLPARVLVKYEDNPDVYRMVINSRGETVLRHVPNERVLRLLAFRSDRIIIIRESYVIDSGVVTGDEETPPTDTADTDNDDTTTTDASSVAGICDATGAGVCLYVSPHAADGNGSYQDPYRTFYQALIDDRLVPGSVIYAMSGTFTADHAMVIRRNPYFDGDRIAMIGIVHMDGYMVDTPAYDVPNGTAAYPITITAYPGANPVIDMRGAYNTDDIQAISHSAVYIEGKSHWIIDGLKIYGGMVNLAGGSSGMYTHNIDITNNTVAYVEVDGGDNPGLIRIDRTYGADGVHDIRIQGNTLHTIHDVGETPNTTSDAQHFGGVTVLSRQEYEGFGIGTRDINITENTFYNLPQAFFFKNPMSGFDITNNTIRDLRSLGIMNASDGTFADNLVINVPQGFWRLGSGGYADSRMTAIDGNNLTITNNTFVGLNSLLELRSGTGHVVTDNIFYGIAGLATGAIYDTPAYIYQSEYYPDSLDLGTSKLHDIVSNDNCFFVPSSDAQLSARYVPTSVTGSGLKVEHYNIADTQRIFGFDVDSVFNYGLSSAAVFMPDYSLREPELCEFVASVPVEDPPTESPVMDVDLTPEPDLIDTEVVPETGNEGVREYIVTVESSDAYPLEGSWSPATAASNHYSSMSFYTVVGGGVDTYQFNTPADMVPDTYEVFVWNSCYTPRNTSILHRIIHADGITEIRLNQDGSTGTCGQWEILGTVSFDGVANLEGVQITDVGAISSNGVYIGVDAVRFITAQ